MTPLISPRTVIEAFLPPTGGARLADIYDIANLAGLEDQPVRLAIRRLVASGDAEQAGRGRAGTLSLTSSGRERLERDRRSLGLAFAQDAGEAPWDGHWRLMAVTTPERQRTVRDTLRRSLHDLGAVAISTGLYVSPHNLFTALPDGVEPYLSTATTVDLNVRGTTHPQAIAEALWPSEPTMTAYSALDEALHRDVTDSTAPAVVRMLYLADALELAIRDDPLLPLELRTEPWAPSRARAAWAHRWDMLSQETETPIYPGW
ncbi:PaaX family transcriptional regulator [Brachybacterium paraconglomeratum]|uniref:PaaX family transcriptional regulator n=1 Tax=Brachybacterium paraconglomeratum TaxID=173362 RepID=UPI003FD1D601